MLVKYQIFISSTYQDLKEERDQVIKACLEMGHIPVGMEMFSAADEEQWKVITRQIDQSDYYVVLVAHRYGSVVDAVSFTEKEYDYAVQKGIPIIGFVIENTTPWPSDRMESDTAKKLALDNFKEKVKRKPVGFWSSASDLHGKFSIALMKLINTNPRPGWARASDVAGPEVMMELSRLSSENSNLRKQLAEAQRKDEEGKLTERKKVFETLAKNKIDVYIWKDGAKDWSEPKESNLFILFNLIAPDLIIEKSTEGVADYIGLMFSNGERIRKTWPVPSNSVRIWLSDLLALGLVKPSERKHPVQDKNEYWTLTEQGKEIHAVLRRIDLENPPGKAEEKQGIKSQPKDSEKQPPTNNKSKKLEP